MREPDDAKVSRPVLGGAGGGDVPMPTQHFTAHVAFRARTVQNNSPNFGFLFAKSQAAAPLFTSSAGWVQGPAGADSVKNAMAADFATTIE